MTAPDETAAASRGRKPRSPEAQLQRREEIMRSALACFKRKGFHNVSMADIAREDGMSVGNLYNFFENKDAIIEAFAEREILRIRRHLCTDSEHYEEQEACLRTYACQARSRQGKTYPGNPGRIRGKRTDQARRAAVCRGLA